MAYPMIALTTAGTSFACASISLTETGLAVLDDNGGRTGFVPYDSLAYVAPTEEARVKEAPMTVHVADGSTFGAASLSQTAAGVAVLDHSGSRVGFVPYDTLTYALPTSKTGPTLPADATPPEGVEIDEEDDGGSPVWEGDRERSDEHGEDATGGDDGQGGDGGAGSDGAGGSSGSGDDEGGVWGEDPVEESDRDESAGETKEEPRDGGSEGGSTEDGSEDGSVEGGSAEDGSEDGSVEGGSGEDGSEDGSVEGGSGEDGSDSGSTDGDSGSTDGTGATGDGGSESADETLPCGCSVECTCGAHGDAEGDAGEAASEPDAGEADAPAAGGEREEAEESELVVEWSFGENA